MTAPNLTSLAAACLLWLALSPGAAYAQTACRGEAAVQLAIDLSPPESSTREQLWRQLAAELSARDIPVCPSRSGQRMRALVLVRTSPELHPAQVRVQDEAGQGLERDLDMAALPLQARPSAIASSAGELLASLLPAASAPARQAAAPPAPAVHAREGSEPGLAAAPSAAWAPPQLELGAGLGTARFAASQSYSGELLARWRPVPRLSVTAHLGGGRLSSEWRDYQRDLASIWRGGLDAGLSVLEPRPGFGLSLHAGLVIARVERTWETWVASETGQSVQRQALGSSWEAAGSMGVEGSLRAGPFGISLGAALLMPFSASLGRTVPAAPTEPTSSNYAVLVANFAPPPEPTGPGETAGAELSLRLWVALDPSD